MVVRIEVRVRVGGKDEVQVLTLVRAISTMAFNQAICKRGGGVQSIVQAIKQSAQPDGWHPSTNPIQPDERRWRPYACSMHLPLANNAYPRS